MPRKTLIVYYSRSKKSEMVAHKLQGKLGCDMDKLGYAGKERISFFAAGGEALKKAIVTIKGDAHNPADYERLIFISPVWASALSTPIRSYMAQHKTSIKSYSLIAVCGGSGLEGCIKDAVKVLGNAPERSEQYLAAKVAKDDYDLGKFVG